MGHSVYLLMFSHNPDYNECDGSVRNFPKIHKYGKEYPTIIEYVDILKLDIIEYRRLFETPTEVFGCNFESLIYDDSSQVSSLSNNSKNYNYTNTMVLINNENFGAFGVSE